MDIVDIHEKIKKYFSLLMLHQAKGNYDLVMTFNKGYWWCESHKEINDLEMEFVSVGKKSDKIFKVLADTKNKKDITRLIHLLGWSHDADSAGKILERYLFSSNTEWSSAAARALLPLIATGKYNMDIKQAFALLHKRSKFCKNKALGLLAFWPSVNLTDIFSNEERKYIERLSNHADISIIANPANMVLKRFEK